MPTTEGYNGAYTGPQIDAAIAAVSGKQDKLTGQQGQVVGFGEDGNARAQDVPESGAPAASSTVTLLSANWTQDADGRYKQVVSVPIVHADSAVVTVDVALSGTDLDADMEALNAWTGPSAQNAAQAEGELTFYSAEQPTVNIPVHVGVS